MDESYRKKMRDKLQCRNYGKVIKKICNREQVLRRFTKLICTSKTSEGLYVNRIFVRLFHPGVALTG